MYTKWDHLYLYMALSDTFVANWNISVSQLAKRIFCALSETYSVSVGDSVDHIYVSLGDCVSVSANFYVMQPKFSWQICLIKSNIIYI